jgi:hypothetical protein
LAWIGFTVERVVLFGLGGENVPKAEDWIAKAEALLKKVEAWELARRAMMGPRQNDDMGACMPMLRKYPPEAERLRDEASELPMALRWPGVAAGHLIMCATCLKSAEEHCVLARQSIEEAEKILGDAKK